ncbi:class F sortase [Pengzhenrongella sicca]|uniref:Class F sortase n=1 Tax=Pengzhenrongella sicca TaxID=2819238 RepID=A0A8A4ZFV1_9MICO|nr:class F sortase [Pengzhenrongella sicca]QTE30165.1 class F sortase [Pengzhenrongella sicca]
MSTTSSHPRRRGVLAAAAGVLALAGVGIGLAGLHGQDGPPQPATVDRAAAAAADPADAEPAAPADSIEPTEPAATDLGPVLPASAPVALDIPSIGVHSTTLVPLSVGADGVLPAPTDFATPGWYTGGPNPGQFGPAVIAGHVDGPGGPAVFYRLGELTPGAQVQVTRQDGSVATFTIDSVESYAKAEFPTSRVYGNTTNRAELRLITCGGAFDESTGHYVDNIIAFGHLVG